MMVRWLRFCASNAKCVGSIPSGGTKILQAPWCGQKKKPERCNQSQEMSTAARSWETREAILGTSRAVQGLRLHPPNAGAQVQSLVRELEPTFCN